MTNSAVSTFWGTFYNLFRPSCMPRERIAKIVRLEKRPPWLEKLQSRRPPLRWKLSFSESFRSLGIKKRKPFFSDCQRLPRYIPASPGGFEPLTFRLGVRPGRINGVISDARKVKEYQAFPHLLCQPYATAWQRKQSVFIWSCYPSVSKSRKISLLLSCSFW